MKSVFRTIVTEPDGSQVQKVVLAQPNATTGNPAIGEALNAAVAAAGTGAVGQSCAWVGDATVNATARAAPARSRFTTSRCRAAMARC